MGSSGSSVSDFPGISMVDVMRAVITDSDRTTRDCTEISRQALCALLPESYFIAHGLLDRQRVASSSIPVSLSIFHAVKDEERVPLLHSILLDSVNCRREFSISRTIVTSPLLRSKLEVYSFLALIATRNLASNSTRVQDHLRRCQHMYSHLPDTPVFNLDRQQLQHIADSVEGTFVKSHSLAHFEEQFGVLLSTHLHDLVDHLETDIHVDDCLSSTFLASFEFRGLLGPLHYLTCWGLKAHPCLIVEKPSAASAGTEGPPDVEGHTVPVPIGSSVQSQTLKEPDEDQLEVFQAWVEEIKRNEFQHFVHKRLRHNAQEYLCRSHSRDHPTAKKARGGRTSTPRNKPASHGTCAAYFNLYSSQFGTCIIAMFTHDHPSHATVVVASTPHEEIVKWIMSNKAADDIGSTAVFLRFFRQQLKAWEKTKVSWFKPSSDTDQRFFLSDQTVRNILACLSPNLCLHDGEALVLALATLLGADQDKAVLNPSGALNVSDDKCEPGVSKLRVFYRQGDAKTNAKFLLVAQTHHMCTMMQQFGDVVGMDATHGTTAYGLYLFFVVLKDKHLKVQIAAFFICAEQTSEIISEALAKLKAWSGNTWSPHFVALDNAKSEWSAVKSVFPNAEITMCAFHLNDAVWRHLRNEVPAGAERDRIYDDFRNLRLFDDLETYSEKKAKFLVSIQAKTDLKRYFSNVWFACEKTWARAFRQGPCMAFETNNAAESTNSKMKKIFVWKGSMSVTSVVRTLLEDTDREYCRQYETASAICQQDYDHKMHFTHEQVKEVSYLMLTRGLRHANLDKQARAAALVAEGREVKKLEEGYGVRVGPHALAALLAKNKPNETLFYKVLPETGECSCPSFRRSLRPCKHLFYVLRTHALPWPKGAFQHWHFRPDFQSVDLSFPGSRRRARIPLLQAPTDADDNDRPEPIRSEPTVAAAVRTQVAALREVLEQFKNETFHLEAIAEDLGDDELKELCRVTQRLSAQLNRVKDLQLGFKPDMATTTLGEARRKRRRHRAAKAAMIKQRTQVIQHESIHAIVRPEKKQAKGKKPRWQPPSSTLPTGTLPTEIDPEESDEETTESSSSSKDDELDRDSGEDSSQQPPLRMSMYDREPGKRRPPPSAIVLASFQ
eukprot:m.26179 g.26179  ORF g.26179 m.26179 type:complete len:1122 (+) comp38276_c0_seq1:26-3391(+)